MKHLPFALRSSPFALGLLAYAALIALSFWPTLATGAVPLPLMNAYARNDPAWSAFPPPHVADGANPTLTDVSDFYYPYVVFITESLRRGELPLWNPQIFGGMPFLAANQAALLFPINLLTFWLGPHAYWAAAAALRMLISSLGMFLLARRLGARPLAAWLAGTIYTFALFNVVWLHFAIHNVAALLPLALWLLMLLIEEGRRRSFLALAGVFGAQMLGGHPETSVSFLLVCGAFTLAWLVGRKRWLRPGALVALALALGLGLSAVQWAPTLKQVLVSATSTYRSDIFARGGQGEGGGEPAQLGGVRVARWGNARHWLLLLQPELWGDPRGTLWASPKLQQVRYWLPDTNYNEMASYVGIVALPLAALAVFRAPQRRAARFFAGLAVVGLLLQYPLPGLARITALPVLSHAQGIRPSLWLCLALAPLAGLGLDQLAQARSRDRWLVALALVALAAVSALVTYDLWGGARMRWALGEPPDERTRAIAAELFRWPNARPLLPAAAALLAAGAVAFSQIRRKRTLTEGQLQQAATPAVRQTSTSAIVRVSESYAALRSAFSAPLRWIIAALATAELWLFGYGYSGFTPPEAIYPPTPISAFLGSDPAPHRSIGPDGPFSPNRLMTQGLQSVDGLDDLVELRQYLFIRRGIESFVNVKRGLVLTPAARRLLDLMNARYLVTRQSVLDATSEGPVLPLALKYGNARIYRVDTALPRAFAATGVVLATPATADDIAYSARFDPRMEVVLEQPIPGFAAGSPAPIASVPIARYATGEVVLRPSLAAPAVVVLADSYDPDWRVTVDGQEAPLLRANGIFRGVVVPAGPHEVVFRYRPALVYYGALAGLASLAICVAIALRGRRRRPTNSAPALRR